MTIRYENTLQDATAYNEFCSFRTPRLRRSNRIRRILLSLSVIALSWLLGRLILGGSLDSSTWIPMLFGAAFIFALHPLLARIAIRRQVKYMTKIGAYKAFLGDHTLILAPDGLHSVSVVGESRYNWHAITEIKQSEDQIFLFMSETAALPVPRRAFADAAHEAAFLAEIERYRAGAVAVPTVASATTTTPATHITNSPVSNAPWWIGQTVSSVEADAKATINQRNG